MNKYLVENKDAKYIRRSLVLGSHEWTEETDEKGQIWFNTDIDQEHFERIAKNAIWDRENEETGFLSVKFERNPKKPGVVHCLKATMDISCTRRISEETMYKYIRLMEQERNRKYTDEEIEEEWIIVVPKAKSEDISYKGPSQ